MNATQAENLRTLIRHMETKVVRRLEMSQVMSACGTPACALGECTLIPALGCRPSKEKFGAFLFVGGKELGYVEAAMVVFGTEEIFEEGDLNPWASNDVSPQEWAIEARKVLAKHDYAMDDGFVRFMDKVRESVELGSYAASHR